MKQGSRFDEQFFQTHGPAIRLAAPAEGEDLIDEIARPLARAPDLREGPRRRPPIRPELSFRRFRISEDRTDDIIEVVRDAAGEGADRFHAAGSLQVCLQARALPLEVFARDGVGDAVESHAQQTEFRRLRNYAGPQ